MTRLEALRAIAHATTDAEVAQSIDRYYRNLDFAEATPRHEMYFHIGELCGILLRLTGAQRSR